MIEPREKLREKWRVQAANGIAEAQPDVPFEILLANFTQGQVKLPKNTIVVHAVRPTAAIHPLHRRRDRELINSVLALPEGTQPDDQPDLDGHTTGLAPWPPKEAKAPDEDPPERWEDSVDLGNLDEETRTLVFEMLSRYQHMWKKGYLGTIDVTLHRIRIKEGSVPARQIPYRQGLEQRKVTEKAIQEMLDAGVIEPASN